MPMWAFMVARRESPEDVGSSMHGPFPHPQATIKAHPTPHHLPLPLRMSIGLAFLTVDAYYRRFIGPHDFPMYLFMFISAPCVTVHSSIKTCNWHHANDIYDSFYDSFMTDRSHCNI